MARSLIRAASKRCRPTTARPACRIPKPFNHPCTSPHDHQFFSSCTFLSTYPQPHIHPILHHFCILWAQLSLHPSNHPSNYPSLRSPTIFSPILPAAFSHLSTYPLPLSIHPSLHSSSHLSFYSLSPPPTLNAPFHQTDLN